MPKADPNRFDDLFAEFGPIELRRMFGGEGIYADGNIIGIIIADVIYFKTDDVTRQAFLDEGCKPFSYRAQGKNRESNTYYAMPDRLYDDPDELAAWARTAFGVTKTKQAGTKPRKAHAGPSLALGAFAAGNGPQDHFALPSAKRGSRARKAKAVTREKPKAKAKTPAKPKVKAKKKK